MLVTTDNKKIDLRSALIVFSFVVVLLLTNVLNINKQFYSYLDILFNPFLISGRSVARNSSLFIAEFARKNNVLQENIQLRRELLQFDQLKVKNQELEEQVRKLEDQTRISRVINNDFQLVKVIGVQSLLNSSPQILLYMDSENSDLKLGSAILYDTQTLLGFVTAIESRTIRVSPFYSESIVSKVPVQNVAVASQKGFITPIESGVVKIKNLPKEYVVKDGDIWMTTNDVAEVPPSLIVGKVKKVTVNQQDGYQEAELQLPFSPATLSYVLIQK